MHRQCFVTILTCRYPYKSSL